MEKKQKVSLTLSKEMMKFLNSLPRTFLPSKSDLIDKLLVEYSSSLKKKE